jgi:hypothetical protein
MPPLTAPVTRLIVMSPSAVASEVTAGSTLSLDNCARMTGLLFRRNHAPPTPGPQFADMSADQSEQSSSNAIELNRGLGGTYRWCHKKGRGEPR